MRRAVPVSPVYGQRSTVPGPPGPAGYNATGAVEDMDTLADYINATGGENPVSIAFTERFAPLTARLDDYENSTPTLEELVESVFLGTSIAATTSVPFHVAAFNSQVNSFTLAVSGAVTTSDTNYWTVTLKRYRQGTAAVMSSKTTRVSDGQEILPFVPWGLDSQAWGNEDLIIGDVLVATFTPTGSPAPLTNLVATFGAPPAFTVSLPHPGTTLVAADNFNRADAAAPLGTSSSGHLWVPDPGNTGTFRVTGNEATQGSGGAGRTTIDTGQTDVRVQCKVAAVGGSGTWGLVLRYVDFDNHLGVTQNSFFTSVGGATTQLVTFGTPLATGDTVAVELVGNHYAVFIDRGTLDNYVLEGSGTNGAYTTGGKHGLRSSGNGHEWDDFKVFA